jgi:hypothetical protein
VPRWVGERQTLLRDLGNILGHLGHLVERRRHGRDAYHLQQHPGRVVMNGGEFNLGVADDTNLGAIYYPSLGAWTKVAPPSFMTKIGDAPSVVLNNGTYLLASCYDFPGEAALFNATPPFTSAKWTLIGSGKANSFYNEEGLTVLPNGNVLDVEVQNDAQGKRSTAGCRSAVSGGPCCRSPAFRRAALFGRVAPTTRRCRGGRGVDQAGAGGKPGFRRSPCKPCLRAAGIRTPR